MKVLFTSVEEAVRWHSVENKNMKIIHYEMFITSKEKYACDLSHFVCTFYMRFSSLMRNIPISLK